MRFFPRHKGFLHNQGVLFPPGCPCWEYPSPRTRTTSQSSKPPLFVPRASSRGQTPRSCTLLHPMARENENRTIRFLLLLLLFSIFHLFVLGFFLFPFHFTILPLFSPFFLLKHTVFLPPELHILFFFLLRRHQSPGSSLDFTELLPPLRATSKWSARG